MTLFEAISLGLLQGITEFLPISSTGHLVLARNFLSITPINALAFDAILHLATALAVILYFRKELWILAQTALRRLSKLPVNKKDEVYLLALLAGTVPAVVLGVGLESVIEENLQTPIAVASILFVGALFFMFAEWRCFVRPPHGEVNIKNGFLIGCYQALALLPGFSRSGATIAGGMLLGLSRFEASRFSFLLAIPITVGVGLKKLLDLINMEGPVEWLVIAVGAFTAFVVAYIVIHWFLSFIRRYTLWPFIWYSIILSGLIFYATIFA